MQTKTVNKFVKIKREMASRRLAMIDDIHSVLSGYFGKSITGNKKKIIDAIKKSIQLYTLKS